jgi:hypothetical protein
MLRWLLALAGLFLVVFSILGLSGPGLLDIIDGRIRYEVARSYVERGDLDVRDEGLTFTLLPGREGRRYSQYRFPQSAAGVVAILASDATGPVNEDRRKFFFSMIGAVACGALAVTYAALFRHFGLGVRASLLWALGGIICTPSWYYGTSTFDDILGTAAVVLAVAASLVGRRQHRVAGAIISGLALGLAFNCKQPLGIFVLPVLAAFYDPERSWRRQWRSPAIVAAMVAAGLAAYEAYEWYKFPPGTTSQHAEILKEYVPVWSGDPVFAFLILLLSPASGIFFYFPPVWLCGRGVQSWYPTEKPFCRALAVAIAVFAGFICCLTFFKGDPAWGPRYLTPVFAILWIMAPAGYAAMRRPRAITLLIAGLVVQVLALGVDPRRLNMENNLPSVFYMGSPELYFHPAVSHLLNRPREIADLLSASPDRPVIFQPPPERRFPNVVFLDSDGGLYSHPNNLDLIDAPRPWWMSLPRLGPGRSPVDVPRTALLLGGIFLAGSLLMLMGLKAPVNESRHHLESAT